MGEFYSCERLLKTKDKNGETPELFMVCSRVRGPGKTFSFSKKLVDDFYAGKGKFVLLTRNMKDLGSYAEGVLKSMLSVHYPNTSAMETIRMKGTYSDIFLQTMNDEEGFVKEHCGYVIPISAADKIKSVSSMFSDSVCAFFDEFQPSDVSTYLKNEVDKFLSIHTSIARGAGKSVRYYPVYMSSNTINIYNPYFQALGLCNKLQSNTKFYRGDGFVFERCELKNIAKQHASSGLNRAFGAQRSIQYGDNSWLTDGASCVCKPGAWGSSIYFCTLQDDHGKYGVRFYPNVNIYYVDRKFDSTCEFIYNISLDGELNIPFIRSSNALKTLREEFLKGNLRMKDVGIKQTILDLLA